MVLPGGIGFEAGTVEREADREAKNRFGMLAYVLAGALQELRNRSFKTQLKLRTKSLPAGQQLSTIANAALPLQSWLQDRLRRSSMMMGY